MNYLFVVAHPDDELLGAGATIAKLCEKGDEVTVLYLTKRCKTRPEEDLLKVSNEIYRQIGYCVNTIYEDFECLGIRNANHYEVVESIERAIISTKPDFVFTHHPADINIDHNEVAKACIEAVKLPIRMIKDKYNKIISGLYFMQVPSSTDWSNDVSLNSFKPDLFVEISEYQKNAKVSMLSNYEDVMREDPHPRSFPNILARLKVEGAKVGFKYAESFQTGFRCIQ